MVELSVGRSIDLSPMGAIRQADILFNNAHNSMAAISYLQGVCVSSIGRVAGAIRSGERSIWLDGTNTPDVVTFERVRSSRLVQRMLQQSEIAKNQDHYTQVRGEVLATFFREFFSMNQFQQSVFRSQFGL